MPWSLIDSALYHLLRGTTPQATERKLVDRFGAGAPEAARAVRAAMQGIACGAMCAGRQDEPIDLTGIPVNRAIPDNTYRFLVGIGIGERDDREVVVDITYESPGIAFVSFSGGRVTPERGPLVVSPAPLLTPQEIFALAWQAVEEKYPERKGADRTFTFRAISRGLFRERRLRATRS